ncbi:hypothetical protein [Pseudomonas triclosanedens]|uniref:hypothetical protein n=1 Tax=Pseudomonas triclosanedens TaxID=2961893 RepID=UPI0020C3BFBA|nr:hypothetical protein [Pseudomonas triclosanedens]ELR2939949.1 hypothetical protein [Pseudomonas aeruginosa]MCP8473810.1 hypothetical protein [Pseudomonas triclosanedens]
MDEVTKARSRKFAEQIRNAGWALEAGQGEAITSSGFWLYSYSLDTGPRLVGQLTVEGYRAMSSGELLRLVGPETKPADVLGSFLESYDALVPALRNRESSELLTMALALYASQTQTLASLPSLQSGNAQHLMVFDWKVRAGHRVLRPAAAVHPTTLSPEMLDAFSQRVLAMHLQRAPHEMPI